MFDTSELLHKLGQLKNFPWKICLLFTSLSFIAAASLSIFIAHVFSPKIEKYKLKESSQNSVVISEKASLTDGERKLIIKRNIFNLTGEVGDDADDLEGLKAQEKGDSIVKSSLALKLRGLIYGGDPFSGLAVLEDTIKKNISSFMVGDIIAEDTKLIEVHPKKIILQRSSGKEFIELEEPELVRSKRKKNTAKAKEAPKFASGGVPETFKEEGFERKGGQIMMSADYKRKVLGQDLAKVLQDAKAEPYLVNGELSGFRLTRIREDSIYQKSGFLEGDLVKEINGLPLTDTAQAIKLLNSLKDEREIEVRLERDSKNLTISLQVNQ